MFCSVTNRWTWAVHKGPLLFEHPKKGTKAIDYDLQIHYNQFDFKNFLLVKLTITFYYVTYYCICSLVHYGDDFQSLTQSNKINTFKLQNEKTKSIVTVFIRP